jgi:hypothetical protein
VPAGTPWPFVDRMNAEIAKAVRSHRQGSASFSAHAWKGPDYVKMLREHLNKLRLKYIPLVSVLLAAAAGWSQAFQAVALVVVRLVSGTGRLRACPRNWRT